MAAVDNGIAHVWGITGTVTNASVQSFSEKKEFALKGTTENESGLVVERRSDDRTTTVTIGLKVQSGYAMPNIGDDLTFNSIVYEITAISKEEKNKDFRMVTVECVTSEGITLT